MSNLGCDSLLSKHSKIPGIRSCSENTEAEVLVSGPAWMSVAEVMMNPGVRCMQGSHIAGFSEHLCKVLGSFGPLQINELIQSTVHVKHVRI